MRSVPWRIRAISPWSRRLHGSHASSRSRAVLTHMHIDLDYATLARALPEGVEPAYDGMVLEAED